MSVGIWNSSRRVFLFCSGVKTAVRVARLEINYQMYETLPRKLLSCVSVVGGFIVAMACTLLR